MTTIRFSDTERRARLVARNHLGRTAPDVCAAVRGVGAMHSTDPATPYLAARARVPDFGLADLDQALFGDRALWRLHAMRRTLFIVPAEEWPVFEAGAARDVARQERRRLLGWLEPEVGRKKAPALLRALEDRVVTLLEDGIERRTQELTGEIPELGMQITLGSGRWATRSPLSSRLLFLLAMDGRIVRTRPAGSWRSSQYHWSDTRRWFGAVPPPIDPEDARVELARRYLATHGPATLEDLRWWTGWTAAQARAAVQRLGAVEIRLDPEAIGLVLPDDTAAAADPSGTPTDPLDATVTFLPALDPTPMGWTRRDWFLGDHGSRLFDRNGNVGPTIWVAGRIVGGWAQRTDGTIAYRLLEEVHPVAAERVAAEALSLQEWLNGTTVIPRFRTPLERELSDAPSG